MNILDSRILLKRSTTAGEVPTIPATSNHTDGTWTTTDIYSGETFVNTVDQRAFVRLGSDVKEIPLQNSLIGTYKYAQKTLTSAQIKLLSSAPITLIPAPPTGQAIFVKNIYTRLNYNSIAYSDNILYVKFDGATDNIGELNNFLKSTISKFANFSIFSDFLPSTTSTGFLEHQALYVFSNTNPTLGNSTIDLLVEYQILDFNSIF